MTGAACLIALAAIPAGASPVAGDFAAGPCPAEIRPALRYDGPSRALVAARDIEESEAIAAPPASLLPDVRAGAPLYLIARVGTVLVEREVIAAQPGRRGQAIFVRTPDGRLVSAPMTGEAR